MSLTVPIYNETHRRPTTFGLHSHWPPFGSQMPDVEPVKSQSQLIASPKIMPFIRQTNSKQGVGIWSGGVLANVCARH
jgi:hypothetical protein